MCSKLFFLLAARLSNQINEKRITNKVTNYRQKIQKIKFFLKNVTKVPTKKNIYLKSFRNAHLRRYRKKMCQIWGKNDFFLVVVEKNKLDIIYQREKRFQKIVNYFRNSIVIEKYVLKKFTIFFYKKKYFYCFLAAKRTGGQNK